MLTENNVKNFAFKFSNISEKKVRYLMSLPIKDRAKQFYATTTLIGLTFLIGKNKNLIDLYFGTT